MRDGIMLTVADDGTARVYDDTYDIVIHCESQEEHDKAMEMLRGIKPKTTGSGFNGGKKDENWEARITDGLISKLSEIRSGYNCFDENEEPFYRALSEAIKALTAQPEFNEWCTDCGEYDHERHCCPRFNKVIREALKDAQPKRKEGEWIEKSTNGEMFSSCSVCGYAEWDAPRNFCPNCGARMEES